MSKPVVITADSPIDLIPALAEQFHISVIPLYITLGEKTYRDGVDISTADIFERYEAEKIIPHTSAIPIADYISFFREFADKGNAVIHFSLSSAISSTHQNALIAAEEFSDVHVVDSLNLSTGIALLAVKACAMRDEELDAKEIVDAVNALRARVCQSFVIDKLEFLRKGGRCSALTALGANVLNIHPSIEMVDGKLELAKKYRGKIETIQMNYLQDQLQKHNRIHRGTVLLCHSGIPAQQVEALRRLVEDTLDFEQVFLTEAGCTISTHCGPNCLGLAFLLN
jgi:DegV family protein with EDD domain